MQPVLSAKEIVKAFSGVRALSNGQIELFPGEIHALVGENGAGKSTIIKILTGIYRKDGGVIEYEGKPYEINTIEDSKAIGLAVIHQELSIVKALTSVENIFLGDEILKGRGFVKMLNKKEMTERAKDILATLGVSIPIHVPAGGLSVAQCQMIEIAKALHKNVKILILDEPTTALTLDETEALFAVLYKLREQGVAIMYVSHRMEEVFRISDRITIFRDGQFIASRMTADTPPSTVISLMVGRDLNNMYPKKENETGEVILKVRHLSRNPRVKDVSFDLHKGELLGIGGLVGAGRTETARILAGVDQADSGTVELEGRPLHLRHTSDAIRQKIVFVPEDRKRFGLHTNLSVNDNLSIATLRKYERAGVIAKKREAQSVDSIINKLSIKAAGKNILVKALSGGNQQKIAIGKWILVDGIKLFILDEPTRGVDVGAKFEIYKIMEQILQQGASILMVSSDLPELMAMSDRIIIMREGVVTGELRKGEISEEAVMKLATGGK